jgi:2-dehydro-3-deoxy-D-arabinonate dehydratase
MHLTRYIDSSDGAAGLAVLVDDSFRRLDLDLDELLRLPLNEIRELVAKAVDPVGSVERRLPPVAGRVEVWGAGVTYERSRAARVEESQVADVYSLVYEAHRPELFFKSVGWRVMAEGDPIGIREDSPLNVPEPEVAVVANRFGEIVGYTVCNDVSSRSIEGENPLYLSQAKIYAGACAVYSGIRPAWELTDPADLSIRAEIRRGDDSVWMATGSTSRMRRTFTELVDWAFRAQEHPDGLVLTTGTMLVPEMDVSLEDGDIVTIEVEQVGTLTNHVRRGLAAFQS